MKKILSLVIVIAIILSVPVYCYADDETSGQCGDNVYWSIDGDTLYVYGNGDMWDYEGEVGSYGSGWSGTYASYKCNSPWGVAYYSMVGDKPKENFKNVTNVMVCDGVTRVGEYSFFASKFENVYIAGSVAVIGKRAFDHAQVMNIGFGDGVSCIEDEAFSRSNLSKVEFPSTLKVIGDKSFSDTKITSVNIPDGVVYIGTEAFSPSYYYNQSFADTYLPKSVQTLGLNAFGQGVLGLNVDENNPYFYSIDGIVYTRNSNIIWAVSGGREYEWLEIPEGTTEIVKEAFKKSKVKNIIIPDSVTIIGEGAFNESSIESVKLPSSLECIDKITFLACKNLKTVEMPKSMKYIKAGAFEHCNQLGNVTIPNDLIYIDDMAFNGCSSISEVKLPSTLNYIGELVFSDCGLTNINIPDSAKYIGRSAFSFCKNLEYVHLPQNLEVLSQYTFRGCENLKQVNFPDTLTDIEYSCFDSNAPFIKNLKITDDGFIILGQGLLFKYIPQSNVDVLYIPDGVKIVCSNAFDYEKNNINNYTINSMVVPNSVIKLETYSISYDFISQYSVKTIDIPLSVAEIGSGNFGFSYNRGEITVNCIKNSYTHQYCINNGISFEAQEDNANIDINQKYVDKAHELGIVPDYFVYPGRIMNNIQNTEAFISVIGDTNLDVEDDDNYKINNYFSDYQKEIIKKAHKIGIINYEDYAPEYKFDTQRYATLGDCYVYICRLNGWEQEEKNIEGSENLSPLTNDWYNMPDWMQSYITVLNNHGIKITDENGNANADKPATLGDTCKLITEYLVK